MPAGSFVRRLSPKSLQLEEGTGKWRGADGRRGVASFPPLLCGHGRLCLTMLLCTAVSLLWVIAETLGGNMQLETITLLNVSASHAWGTPSKYELDQTLAGQQRFERCVHCHEPKCKAERYAGDLSTTRPQNVGARMVHRDERP